MVVRLKISCGTIVLVDHDDVKKLKGFNWKFDKTGAKWYVRATGGGRPYIHRLIMGEPAGLVVDHIDGDTLNNSKLNLRVGTIAQNNKNLAKRRGISSSKYKGVDFHRGQWLVRVAGKFVCYCITEDEAAAKYDEHSAEIFGEFARPNTPRTESK